jgi:hypothetical protein
MSNIGHTSPKATLCIVLYVIYKYKTLNKNIQYFV